MSSMKLNLDSVKLTSVGNEAKWRCNKTQLRQYTYTKSAPVLVCRSPQPWRCLREAGGTEVGAQEAAIRWLDDRSVLSYT